jgi:hypothetical protein
MSLKKLEPGKTLMGLLIDGVLDTHHVGIGITLETDTVTVEIPYSPEAEVFTHVNEWFTEPFSVPTNLLFESTEGTVSLFDVTASSRTQTMGGVAVAKARVNEVVFASATDMRRFNEPLIARVLRSRLDGLELFTGFKASSMGVCCTVR